MKCIERGDQDMAEVFLVVMDVEIRSCLRPVFSLSPAFISSAFVIIRFDDDSMISLHAEDAIEVFGATAA
jgi:hypothetical protein